MNKDDRVTPVGPGGWRVLPRVRAARFFIESFTESFTVYFTGNFRLPLTLLPALLLAVLLTLLLTLPLPWHGANVAQAEPTRYEKREVEAQALEAFRNILGLWKEELYFEIYDIGMESTKKQISSGDFAQRMVELAWVPHGELNAKFLKPKFRFRTMVYIHARVEYRSKFNPDKKFLKDHTFLLLEEKGIWRIDLVQLVRAPYA